MHVIVKKYIHLCYGSLSYFVRTPVEECNKEKLKPKMKRIFTLFVFVLGAMLFVACEKVVGGDTTTNNDQTGQEGRPEDAKKEYTLTLTTPSVMEFAVEGGMGEIGYTLTEVTRANETPDVDIPEEEPVTGDSAADDEPEEKLPLPEVACEAEWITDIAVSSKAVEFKVLPGTGEEREALVALSYEDQKVQVLVRQKGDDVEYDVEFRANYLNGSYYGKLSTYGFNYFIILSDMGAENQNDTYGTQYRFDLYAGESSIFEPVDYVPEGVYVFGECTPGTIDASQSYCLTANGNDVDFASATVTVTENKIVAVVRMMNGEVHRVTYEGSLALDYLEPTAEDVAHSALTSDVNFNVTGGSINAYYRGDYFGKGVDVWFLHMVENTVGGYSGDYLMMDLMVDKSEGGYDNKDAFVGVYSKADNTTENYVDHFAPGYMRVDYMQMHTWFANDLKSENEAWAPFVDGNITITKEGDIFTITMDGIDDKGNKIQGSFSGTVIDYQNQAYDL